MKICSLYQNNLKFQPFLGQFWGGGGHHGGGNRGGGGWGGWDGGGRGHHGGGGLGYQGYGYGSDICAGARRGQQQPQYQQVQHQQQPQYQQQPQQHYQYPSYNQYPTSYNQYPEQGGYYQPKPAPTPTQVQPQPQPSVNYLTNLPTPTTCPYPDTRDTDIFEQKCLFPNEYSQVSCTSRGSSIPAGTSAILTCKSPKYYSSTGDILVEVCKTGTWQGDTKSLTCKIKSEPVAQPQPPPTKFVQYEQQPQQSNQDYIVDYVRKPVENSKPQYTNNYTPTEAPSRWISAPQTSQPQPPPPPVYAYAPTSTSTTTTTTTTTPKPTTTTTTTTRRPYVDWRNVGNSNENQYPEYSNNSLSNKGGMCPSLKLKPGVILECLSKKQRQSGSGYLVSVSDCQEPQIEETDATYKCQMYYEPVTGVTTQYRKCKEGGVWTGSDDGFICTLECGKQNPTGRLPLITFGEVAVLGAFPWHAALFVRDRDPKFTNACGGTLISAKAILTAAHCVNLPYSSLLRNVSDLRVDLGRYYREKDDPYVQKFNVEKVVGHPAYNPWIYESDIAIVILKEKAQIGFHVRPICYPKSQNAAFDELQLADGSWATVVGWGVDETGDAPDELRSAKLKVIGYRECIDSFEESDTGSLLAKSTTFCAGNNNGTNVCRGDSGSGAYFGVKTSEGLTRWYLQGLVSVGINVSQLDKKCDPEKVAIFTRISPYSDWIVRVLSENDAL
ncbi:unnamed protein product [Orchesella dallaii]|uniref:Peptidase S1 domain-containing protein n=1 Tax=Orchesella dallaii TaxID=48710 RepID=A0ABP1Q9J5_9HEXA